MSGDASQAAAELAPVEFPVVAPVLAREIAAVSIWTLFADVLIFRTFGYSGPALFFAAVPALFYLGCPGLAKGPARKCTIALILIVAARMVWLGSGLTVFSAVMLVVALAMSAAGHVPYVLESCVLAGRAMIDGAKRLTHYRLPRRRVEVEKHRSIAFLSWGLPIVAALVFGGIFVLANPDLFNWVSDELVFLTDRIQLWFRGISIFEFPFCVFALLIGIGLMRPVVPLLSIGPADSEDAALESLRSPLYPAFRNTLLVLIALFAVYLVFEFTTLWKKEFPAGFYYAGYAHQGAAWLTYALALATAVLSTIFSGSMLRDDRIAVVRRLAWIWSALNILLAAAVYNRLLIYVGYNGMTRMRTIGFFGITVVVIGFVLVLYKIGRRRSFWWLVRSQLIAFMLTVIAYSVFPVDYVAHRYNARMILSGSMHPSVMIAVKPISDEGYLPLLQLTECDDPIVRDGVLAMLAARQIELTEEPDSHWTQWQGATELLKNRLQINEAMWADFNDPVRRDEAIGEFREYAMEWY